MKPADFFTTEVPERTIDISVSEERIQTSLIIKQDPSKSGILGFLETIADAQPDVPESIETDTFRPTTAPGGY